MRSGLEGAYGEIGRSDKLLETCDRATAFAADDQEIAHRVAGAIMTQGRMADALDLLRRPGATWPKLEDYLCRNLPAPDVLGATGWRVPGDVAEQVVIETLYDHYIATQYANVKRLATMEARSIPSEFDYGTLPSLRAEAREKLLQVRPATLGQAGRIAGVTPTDLAALLAA